MITEEGKKQIATLIKTNFASMDVGTGTDSTNPSANELDSPRTTNGVPTVTSNISSTLANDTGVEFKASFLGSASALTGYTITEVGIFDSSGNMLNRIDFDGVGPITATDILEFTIVVQVK
ncbi:MAG: hypothetical protein GOVbin556_99 [Prokaryotic dsDNA virus sp.]|nr:MAG: hypothetical protein GOVbin556_99 [Prokaryotic dsDNA virus sp.]|tara:strand:+ start:1050 stop:1412 length:363 start_codon:yes stop_codon:yes gene_type:complete